MANGTPSQGIKLGADLLEQLGDLQGAAKALNDQAKDAQKEVREAEKDLRNLERRKAKGESVDTSGAFANVQEKQREVLRLKQRASDLRAQDKIRKADAKEFQNELNSFQKTTMLNIVGVKNNLDLVAKKLTEQPHSATGQAVGRAISSIGAKITPEFLAGAAKVALPVGAAYTGFKIGTKFVNIQHQFRDRANTIATSSGMRADQMREEVAGWINQDLSQSFLDRFNKDNAERSGKASADVARKHLVKTDISALTRDSIPLMGKVLSGATSREVEKEQRRVKRQQESRTLRQAASLYGQSFSDRITVDKLVKSKEVENFWKNHLDENAYQKILSSDKIMKALALTGGGIGITALLFNKVNDMFDGNLDEILLGKEEFVMERAEKMQAGTFKAEAIMRATETRRLEDDPVSVSERHNRATRFAGLEAQRVRREMSWAQY